MLRFIFTFPFILLFGSLFSQNLYDQNTIQLIKIEFEQSNWDYMLDTATVGSDSYIEAKSVTINGLTFEKVGVKYKGNSTYNANQKKNPIHIELDAFQDQDYQGYTDIKLSNVAKDPSFVREVLSYEILRKYMDAPESNYANVYVNGTKLGLYVSSESISKKFVKSHFNSNTNPFFKCNPVNGAGMSNTARPNLTYLGQDSTKYMAAYEIKSEAGWSKLIDLCRVLNENVGNIEQNLDVDRALWMLAFDNLLVNLDSYIGVFAQNYYLYEDNYGRFLPVVWDLNESFGTFSNSGTINLSSTLAKQEMSHLLHLNDAAWPLISKLLNLPTYKKRYVAHLKTMMYENFSDDSYLVSGQRLQNIISSDVTSDPNKFFTFAQFMSNLTTDISGGGGPMPGSTPGITNLMDKRFAYLSKQTDFEAKAPTVTTINVSESTPIYNDFVTFVAVVEDATYVELALRNANEGPFTKIQMYDDGLHQDQVAGDGIYGATVKMDSPFKQYFVYAENELAGIFSPQRAEHEFFSIFAQLGQITPGDLVINELMADNASTVVDSNGDYDDWVELYNNTDRTLDLDNLYFSDSYTNPLKWKFSDGIKIEPHSYLIVWADDDEEQMGIHSTIKLSATGEKAIISYADGSVVDSTTFGIQTPDLSWQRCPNGFGIFEVGIPSFMAENCKISDSSNDMEADRIQLFPNPSIGTFTINSPKTPIEKVEIVNLLGHQMAYSGASKTNQVEIQLSGVVPGFYFVKINNLFVHKILVTE